MSRSIEPRASGNTIGVLPPKLFRVPPFGGVLPETEDVAELSPFPSA